MLKTLICAGALIVLAPAAQAQTVVLLPEAGSMEPPTVIVGKSQRDVVLVCASLSQLSTGGCLLRTWAQIGLRR